MRVTSLSETQRRAEGRRSVLSLPAQALRNRHSSAPDTRKGTAARHVNTWTIASCYEPRPPRLATTLATRPLAKTARSASEALHAAEDEGWPTARGS
jgi:hypothetical protein